MITTKQPLATTLLALLLPLLATGCASTSTRPSAPPVVVQCPAVQPLSQEARQLVPSELPLQSAAKDALKWRGNLQRASGAASAAKPSTQPPRN